MDHSARGRAGGDGDRRPRAAQNRPQRKSSGRRQRLNYVQKFVRPDGGIYAEGSRHKNYETCASLPAFVAAMPTVAIPSSSPGPTLGQVACVMRRSDAKSSSVASAWMKRSTRRRQPLSNPEELGVQHVRQVGAGIEVAFTMEVMSLQAFPCQSRDDVKIPGDINRVIVADEIETAHLRVGQNGHTDPSAMKRSRRGIGAVGGRRA